jgi:hypothetical protein
MLEKLTIKDRRIFLQMIYDEMFYIDYEFAFASDSDIKTAIKESVDELSKGFPALSRDEIKAYMTKKWESNGLPIRDYQ